MGQGALAKPAVQWWLGLNSSTSWLVALERGAVLGDPRGMRGARVAHGGGGGGAARGRRFIASSRSSSVAVAAAASPSSAATSSPCASAALWRAPSGASSAVELASTARRTSPCRVVVAASTAASHSIGERLAGGCAPASASTPCCAVL